MPISPADPRQDLDSGRPAFLVADVGGTNCRLGLAQVRDGAARLGCLQVYKCADFPTAEEAFDAYLRSPAWPGPVAAAVIAVAGPVIAGVVQSTNMPWRISEAALCARGFAAVKVINDYTALALAVDHMAEADLATIGPDVPGEGQATVAVIGAGTGLGAGALVRGLGGQTPIATEGGHIAFAPADEVEIELLRILRRRHGRVSLERLLSGPGLINIREALAEMEGLAPDPVGAERLVQQASSGDELSRRALERFCAIYGAAAGDFALAYGARGGVFLGGGIAPAIVPQLAASDFRRRFEDKGRFGGYMTAIPTRVIVGSGAALLGAAALAATLV